MKIFPLISFYSGLNNAHKKKCNRKKPSGNYTSNIKLSSKLNSHAPEREEKNSPN